MVSTVKIIQKTLCGIKRSASSAESDAEDCQKRPKKEHVIWHPKHSKQTSAKVDLANRIKSSAVKGSETIRSSEEDAKLQEFKKSRYHVRIGYFQLSIFQCKHSSSRDYRAPGWFPFI